MLWVKAENDLRQMNFELLQIKKADGHLKIEEGIKDRYYKPL